MREGTIRTRLDPAPVLLNKLGIARAIRPVVQRAITEQAIKLLQAVMTGKIFTFMIHKKTIRVFHKHHHLLILPQIPKLSFEHFYVNRFFSITNSYYLKV
jgi:hypothetical protein